MKKMSHRSMPIRSKVALSALATAALIATNSVVRADEIQVNYVGKSNVSGAPNATSLTGATNGAPGGDYATWNNAANISGFGTYTSTMSSLMDVSGSLTTASVVTTCNNDFATTPASYSGNNNQVLLYQWALTESPRSGGGTLAPVAAAISSLPASFTDYDVYVYFESNTSIPGHVNINGTGTTYYYTAETTLAGNSDSSQDFVEATQTTASASPPDADYAEFTDLTGSSFTIDVYVDDTTGIGNAGLSGFQIVEVPEPTGLACLGTIAVAGMLRRRSRGSTN